MTGGTIEPTVNKHLFQYNPELQPTMVLNKTPTSPVLEKTSTPAESSSRREFPFGALKFGILAIIIGVAVTVTETIGLAGISDSVSQFSGCGSTVETRPIVGSAAKQPYHYDASPMEQYFIDNSEMLGLNEDSGNGTATCPLVFNDTSPVYDELKRYFEELETYNQLVKEFVPITYDLRDNIQLGETNMEQVCSATKIHPEGLSGVFSSSRMSNSNHAGRMEPILPVMRYHKICDDIKTSLMSMKYLVHDFYSMCMNLKKTSRTVFIDMGASLQFHGKKDSPAVYINSIFRKFGFKFDHIYAYEITKTEPAEVFERVPNELMNSFHWINVGVDPTPGAKLNPFTTLVEHFNADDFIGACR